MSERNKIAQEQRDKEEPFYAGQTRILEMVAANAPLPEILTNLVLLMEAQAEGMLCSILVLTADGMRVRHGAGIWELFIPRVAPGARYKFAIVGPDGARLRR